MSEPNTGVNTDAADQKTGVEEIASPAVNEEVQDAPSSLEGQEEQQVDPEKQGLLQAKIAETKKRQEVEKERDLYRAYLENIMARQTAVQQTQQVNDPFAELQDDEILTVKDLKKLRAKQEQEANSIRLRNSAYNATLRHQNDDMTYEDAYNYAQKNFTPAQFNAIAEDADPCELLYQMVLVKSDVLQTQQTKTQKNAVKSTVEQINRNLNQQKTLSSVGSANRKMTDAQRWANMSDDEILDEANRVMRQKR